MVRLVACVLLLAGCALLASPKEYFVPTNRGLLSRSVAAPTGSTHYFQVNTRRLCYGFEVPGTWQAGREPGVMFRVDGKGAVGGLVLSLRELGAASVDDAIRKAAARSGELYAKESGGVAWTLTPYPRVPGAWQWTLPAEGRAGKGTVVRIPPRWYIPAADGWIAQFTIGPPPDVEADAFVTAILGSLTTSKEPRCYEARLRELGAIGPR